MGILELHDVTLELGGRPILDRLSIDFWEGHIHAIVGPNGAGKSTLAQTIMGLPGYRHFSGEILLDGRSIGNLAIDERARLGISLAWQEPARFEGITVKSFIGAAAKAKTAEAVDEALEMVGLEPERYRSRAVDKTLSGGERKRIELASIIAMRPRIVLMDEPDSGVDIDAVKHIFAALRYLRGNGITVVLITHSAEVLSEADHAFLLCHGQVVDKGAVDKMISYFRGKCIPCTHPNVPDVKPVKEVQL
jgi:Fe-S cluster assembly ATP-binding protein